MTKALIVRQQETELPSTLTLQFINLNADHQPGSQSSRRMSVHSSQTVEVTSPIVFTDGVAKNIADQLMYISWVERDRLTMTAPRAYAWLEPTDVFKLVDPDAGLEYTVRIVTCTESRNGSLAFDCVTDFSPAYVQSAATGNATVVSQVPLTASPTYILIMDLPALRDSDNTAGYYIAMSGREGAWGGGSAYVSWDSGASYSLLDSTSTPSVMGDTSSLLGDWVGGNTVDESNFLMLKPYIGELSSIDMTAFLNGGNLLAVQSGAGWELLQFRRSVLQSDGSYRISGLLRGRFGTEWAMDGHSSTDKFVLLDNSTVRRVQITSAQLGVPMMVKALGIGLPLGSVDPITTVNHGIALRPYSPVVLGGGVDGSGNVIIQWTRRTRIGGTWINNADTPLSEASELYSVEIWNSTFTTLKRTLSATTTTLTYLAADQVTDFGSAQAVVYFRVYQVSATVGRGYPMAGSTDGQFFVPEDLNLTSSVPSAPTVPTAPAPPTSLTPTLFVSSTGSNSNSGRSVLTPLATLGYAASIAVPGDVVSVANGTYAGSFQTNQNGTVDNPITFIAATRWGAKIVPPATSGSVFGWDSFGDYTTIDGFEVDGTVDPTSGTRWRIGLRVNGEGSIARNCHVHHIDRNGVATSDGGAGIMLDSQDSGYNMQAVGNRVHHVGPTSGSSNHHGIYCTSSGSIKNNVTFANTGGGIGLWHDARNVDVANNTSFNNATCGIIYGGGDYVHLIAPCDYVTVTNNICYGNATGIRELGDLGANNVISYNLCNSNTTDYDTVSATLGPVITGDPLFVNYQADGTGDYHIQTTSPAKDAGLVTYAPATDFDGITRPVGIACDIGAFEYH